jgi:hypothetical protein
MLLKFILRMFLVSITASLAAGAIFIATQSALAQPVEHATAHLSLF